MADDANKINKRLHEVKTGVSCCHHAVSQAKDEPWKCDDCGYQFAEDEEFFPPNYGTDISAAFELVEWMRKEKGLLTDIRDVRYSWCVRIRTAVDKNGETKELGHEDDESLPKAIAMAALAALEPVTETK